MYRESPYDSTHVTPASATQATIYPPQRRPRRNWAAAAPYLVACLALAVAAAALVMLLTSRGSADSQLAQLRSALNAEQAQLVQAQSSSVGAYDKLSGKVGAMAPVVGAMTAYGMVCTVDLTGPQGPAQFWYPCTDQKP